MAPSSDEKSQKKIQIPEAAKLSGYSKGYLSYLCRTGKILGTYSHNEWSLDLTSLEGFMRGQSERKEARARSLANSRALEYQTLNASDASGGRPPDVLAPPARRRDVGRAPPLFKYAAGMTALAVITLSALAADALIPPIATRAASITKDAALGFTAAFGDMSARIAMKVEEVRNVEHAHIPLAFADAQLLTELDLSALRMKVDSTSSTTFSKKVVLDTRHVTVAMEEIRADTLPTSTKIITAGDLQTFAHGAYQLLTSPSNMFDAFFDTLMDAHVALGERAYAAIVTSFSAYRSLIDTSGERSLALAVSFRDTYRLALAPLPTRFVMGLGSAVINAAHAAIRADVSLAYGLSHAAPESARTLVTLLGDTGDTLARITARTPALAASFFLNTASLPSELAPRIAQAVFDVEYEGAERFLALRSLGEAGLALAGTAAHASLASFSATGRLAHDSLAYLRAVPPALDDAYLGALGKGALVLRSMSGEAGLALDRATSPLLAAVLPKLSYAEQLALATYESIQNLFDSVNRMLALLLGPPPTIVLSTTPPARSALTILSASTTPTTYTTIIQGISSSFLDQSLATLRADIIATVVGMVNPVAAEVNPIRRYSEAEPFDGGAVGAGVTAPSFSASDADGTSSFALLSAGTSTLTNLTVSNTSTSTFAGPLTTSRFLSSTLGSAASPAFTFLADTTTGLFSPAASTLALSTAGAERLRIDASGNIGIGTSTPDALLSLQQVTNGTPFVSAYRATDTVPSGDFISYKQNDGTTLFRVDNSGNLLAGGIINSGSQTITSVSTPQLRIQYDPTNEFTFSTNSTGTTTIGLNGTAPGLVLTPQSNSTNSFNFTNAASDSVLSIDTVNKRVGVGTTTPVGVLSIAKADSSGVTDLLVNPTTKTSGNLLDLKVGGSSLFSVNSGGAVFGSGSIQISYGSVFRDSLSSNFYMPSDGFGSTYIGNNAGGGNGNIQFQTLGASLLTRMVITATGKVGIGSELSPVNALTVDGALSVGNSSYNVMAPTNGAIIQGNVGIGTTSPFAKLSVHANNGETNTTLFAIASSTASATTTHFVVTNAGNVGIGTLSPATLLHIGTTTVNDVNAVPSEPTLFVVGKTTVNGTPTSVLTLARAGIPGLIYPAVAELKLSSIGGGNGQPRLDFALNAAAAMSTVMSLNYAGNVGIGNTSPSEKLNVQGTVAAQLFTATSTTGNNYFLSNVGIGTTTPGAKLEIYPNANSMKGLIVKGDNNQSQYIIEAQRSDGTSLFRVNGDGSFFATGASQISGSGSLSIVTAGNGLDMLRLSNVAAQGRTYDLESDSVGKFHLNDATAGADRMVIDTSGNVGIGTTSPWGLLSVNPNGITGPAFVVGSSTATNFVVTNGGKVGIGTTDPDNGLTLGDRASDETGSSLNLSFRVSNGSQSDIIWKAADYTKTSAKIGTVGTGSWVTKGLAFYTSPWWDTITAVAERMRITEVGNVGIGTSSPFAQLSVQTGPSGVGYFIPTTLFALASSTASGAVTTHLLVTNTGNVGIGTTTPDVQYGKSLTVSDSGNAVVAIEAIDNTNDRFASLSLRYSGNGSGYNRIIYGTSDNTPADSSYDLQFLSEDSSTRALTSVMTLKSSGNVGIGTTTPGLLNGTLNRLISVEGTGEVGISLNSTEARQYALYAGSDGTFNIFDANANANRISISSTGNVGIGTTSPIAPLSIQGTDSNSMGYIAQFTRNNAVDKQISIFSRDAVGGGLGSSGVLQFSTNLAGGLTDNPASNVRMTIDTSGNVGIGTATPGVKLDVIGTSADYQVARVRGTGAGVSLGYDASGNGLVGNTAFGSIITLTPAGNMSVSSLASAGTRCVQADSTGLLSVAGTACNTGGSGGTWATSTATGMSAYVNYPNNNTDVVAIGATGPSATTTAEFWFDPNVSGGGRAYFGGNVGIGTTSPAHKLHVVGDGSTADVFGISSNSTSVNFDFYTNNLAARRGLLQVGNEGTTGGFMALYTKNDGGGDVTEKVRILASGNVGIGTTSPQRLLHLYGTEHQLLELDRSSGTNNTNVMFAQAGVGKAYVGIAGTTNGGVAGSSAGDLFLRGETQKILFSTDAGVTAHMAIDTSGRVGIGTTSPWSIAANYGTLAIGGTDGGGLRFGKNNGGSGRIYADDGGVFVQAALGSGLPLVFSTGGTERMRILDGGNIGIGTTTPSAKLDVWNASAANDGSYLIQSLNAGSDPTLGALTLNTYIHPSATAANRYISLVSGDNGAYRPLALNPSGGNVGIGTTSPRSVMHIENTSPYVVTFDTDAAMSSSRPAWAAGATGAIYAIGSISSYSGTIANDVTARLVIDATGNVGIGTSTPGAQLEIYSSDFGGTTPLAVYSNSDNITITDYASNRQNQGSLLYVSAPNDTAVANAIGMFGVGDFNDTGQKGNLFRVTQSGNVGIGTTSPGGRGSGAAGPFLNLEASGTNLPEFYIGNSTTTSGGDLGTIGFYGGSSGSEKRAALIFGELDASSVTNPYGRLSFWTANNGTFSERMRIDSSGNVGIGTTDTSTYKVNVNGSLNATEIRVNGTVLNPGTGSNWTVSGSDIYRLAGNVGIGTTTPGAHLEVYGTNPSIRVDSSTASNDNAIQFQEMAANKGSLVWRNSANESAIQLINYTAGPLEFFTTSAERMRIDSSGNVGIGTTSPSLKFHVQDTSTTNQAIFGRSTVLGDSRIFIGESTSADKAGALTYSGSGNYLSFDVSGDSNSLVVANGGNIGIGTTSPSSTLHVNGSGRFTPFGGSDARQIVITTPGGTDGGITFSASSSDATTRVDIARTNGDLAFALGSGTLEKMRITSSGNVGIGTTTPQSKLSVVSGTNGILNFPSGNWAAQIYNQDDTSTSGGLVVGNRWQDNTSTIFEAGSLYGDAGSVWTSRFIVKGLGNVGIGTTSPTNLLHIYSTANPSDNWSGQLQIGGDKNTANQNVLSIGVQQSSEYAFIQANNAGGGAPALALNPSGGNVGIGTTSPQNLLHVDGTNAVIRLTNAGTGSMNSDGLFIGNTSSGETSFDIWNYENNFVRFATNNTEQVRITSAGNVGIGTTSPVADLHIGKGFGYSDYGTLAFGGASASDFTGTAYGEIAAVGGGSNGYGYRIRNIEDGATTYFAIDTKDTSTWTNNRFVIRGNSGNVGIGTTTPTQKLSIAGATTPGLTIDVSDTSSYSVFNFTNAGALKAYLINPGSAFSVADRQGDLEMVSVANDITFWPGGIQSVTMKSSGNVGIGTTSPATLLEVGGATNNVTFDGYKNCTGFTSNGNGLLACTASDQRLKQDISPLAGASGLAAINALNPVSFYWNPETARGSEQQYGFIAQDVRNVFPNLVTATNPTPLTPDGTLSVDYQGLISPMVLAIQQLDARTKFIANAASSTALTVGDAGDIGVGTSLAGISAKLAVSGNVFATSYETANIPATSFTLGSTTLAAQIPSAVLTALGSVDLYKLATYNLSGISALALALEEQEARITSLESRVAALESGAITSTSGTTSLSTTSLTDALNTLGVFIKSGLTQFGTLVADRFVAAADSAGTASAGTVTILAGNTIAKVNNAYVTPMTKVFITFTAPVTGSWYISDKKEGSFKVVLASAQTADASFDYFLVQTEGQMATTTTTASGPSVELSGGTTSASQTTTTTTPLETSTALTGQAATTTTATATSTPSSDTTPPTVTLIGDAAMQITTGSSFTDPGATAVDDTDGDLTAHITVSGTVDITTAGLYTLTYSATDAAGNTGSASRVVTVADTTTSSSGSTSTTDTTTAPTTDTTTTSPTTTDTTTTSTDTTSTAPAPEPAPEPTPSA